MLINKEDSIRYLCVIMDKEMFWNSHINKVTLKHLEQKGYLAKSTFNPLLKTSTGVVLHILWDPQLYAETPHLNSCRI